MLVGFIAVVVILLVIIGIMATSSTSGSGGVDQTKATKLVSEISGLSQSMGFYKTTTANGDYAGLDVKSAINAGIVDINDTDASDSQNPDDATLIKSKALTGVTYTLATSADPLKFDLGVAVEADKIPVDSSLAKAMEKAYTKFGADNATGDSPTDGETTITFK